MLSCGGSCGRQISCWCHSCDWGGDSTHNISLWGATDAAVWSKKSYLVTDGITWYISLYSTSQKKFAVGRPSPADRSEPLIAACRVHPVTAGSGRFRLFSHLGLYSTPCYRQWWIRVPAYQLSHFMSRRSLPPGWRAATPFEACTCIHCAHCTPAELSRNT